MQAEIQVDAFLYLTDKQPFKRCKNFKSSHTQEVRVFKPLKRNFVHFFGKQKKNFRKTSLNYLF